MRKFVFLVLAFTTFVSAPASVLANGYEVPGYLDFAYIDSDYDADIPGVGAGSDSGTGFAARLLMPVGSTAFVHADYQQVTLDDTDSDISITRVGPGMRFPIADKLTLMARVEYISTSSKTPGDGKSSDNGFGFFGMLHYTMAGPFSAWVHAGAFELDSGDGNDVEVGVDLKVTETVSAFLSYHALSYSESGEDFGVDGDIEQDFDEFRIGIRLWFLAYD